MPTHNSIIAWRSYAAPTEDEIISAHRDMGKQELDALQRNPRVFRHSDGSWRVKGDINRVYVPEVNQLRLRLCITAHQQSGEHNGTDVTHEYISKFCYWQHMRDYIHAFCSKCLSCMKTRGGKVVPRPLLHQQQAVAPNEIISFDYCQVRLSKGAHVKQYVLVIVDNFSRLVHFYPSHDMSAATVVSALLDWFTHYGICRVWTSDRGTHFFNDVMRALAKQLRVEHHFTAIYAPWSNGVVERVNRELREALSAVMLDSLARDEDWEYFIPAVTHALNSAPSRKLRGHSPYEVVLGKPSLTPLNAVFTPEPPAVVPVGSFAYDTAIQRLRASLDDIHAAIVSSRRSPSTPSDARTHPVDFGVGDYVLVARQVFDTSRSRDKTRPIWLGPMRVLRKVNERVFEIHDIISDVKKEIHAQHIKLYADKDLQWTRAVSDVAAHGGRGFVPLRILSHIVDEHDLLHVNVEWEDGDLTWERWDRFHRDAPRLSTGYLRSLPRAARNIVEAHWSA